MMLRLSDGERVEEAILMQYKIVMDGHFVTATGMLTYSIIQLKIEYHLHKGDDFEKIIGWGTERYGTHDEK